jgi:1-phosphofructokinase
MITAVNLNPTIDVVCPVISLKRGKVMRTPVIFSYPGGKGLNVARALSALGADAVAAGFAGSANAGEMKNFLSLHGVKPDFIVAPGTNRTCLLIT